MRRLRWWAEVPRRPSSVCERGAMSLRQLVNIHAGHAESHAADAEIRDYSKRSRRRNKAAVLGCCVSMGVLIGTLWRNIFAVELDRVRLRS